MVSLKFFSSKIKQIRKTYVISSRLIALIWKYHPGLLLGNLISKALPAILPFVNIYIYKLIIDFVIESVSQGRSDIRPLYFLIALRIVSYYLQELSYRLQRYVERLLWLKLPIHLSELILTKVVSLDMQYFEDNSFKELLERVNDSYKFRALHLVDYLLYSLQSLIQFSIAVFAISHVHWSLIFVILFAAIVEFLLQLFEADVFWGIWAQNSPYRAKFNYLSYLLQDRLSIKEIKLFNLGPQFIREVVGIQKKFYLETKKLTERNQILGSISNLLSTFVTIGIEVFIISQALVRKLTIGDIGFYTGVINNFQSSLSGLFKNISSVFEESLYVQSIFDLLDAKTFVQESDHPVVIEAHSAPKIEFRDVSFTYPGAKKAVLKNFSLTIQPGEKVAFVGENGAGKSTLIKLLARFYDVDAGEILINDINLKDLDRANWHQHIGILFQDFNRYEHTAKENITFGRVSDAENQEALYSSAKNAGAAEVIEKLEKKYEQLLGKNFQDGIELSTGQWQKIALARSFFRNAPVLVLDEPTASIDAKAEAEIFESVEQLSKDKTVIIISHRFSTVRNADKIYVIENGSILEHGSHQQLMKKKGKYAQLFTLQAKAYQ